MIRNKSLAITILMLQHAMMRHIKHEEHTRHTDKLAKHIRKYLSALWKTQQKWHDSLADDADRVWEDAKQQLRETQDVEDFSVSMRSVILSLYGLLEHSGMPNIAYTEKTLIAATDSIERTYHGGSNDLLVETDSNKLIDIFAKSLGIKHDNTLNMLKRKVAGNLLVDGKLLKEYT